MSCPRCGSNNLWSDQLWWGCENCSFSSDGGVINTPRPGDKVDGVSIYPPHHYEERPERNDDD